MGEGPLNGIVHVKLAACLDNKIQTVSFIPPLPHPRLYSEHHSSK